MSLAHASVTISYADVEAMKEAAAALEVKVAKLEDDLLHQRLGEPGSTARALVAALKHALPIVSYAIAQMPPLSFRGWPYQDLVALVNALPALPDMPIEWLEVKNDFVIFARECERWERARAQGIEQQLFAEENARRAVGPGVEFLAPADDEDGADGGRERDAAHGE